MVHPTPEPRIAVLMTCHNRVALTLRCLAALAGQPGFDPANLYLVDDGSSDGTGEAVGRMLPAAHVLAGDGSLFWNGGMIRAWEAAAASRPAPDWYLWLNDDVELAEGALAALLADARASARPDGAVVCAAAVHETGDPGNIIYGALRCPDPRRPLRMRLVAPQGRPVAADTVSGNVVLVSAAAYALLGPIDPRYEHIYGDLDYGFRARALGIPVILAGKAAGSCEENAPSPALDPTRPRLARLRLRWQDSRKVHARDWNRFVARWDGGLLRRWGHRLSPYLRILTDRPHRHSGSVRAADPAA